MDHPESIRTQGTAPLAGSLGPAAAHTVTRTPPLSGTPHQLHSGSSTYVSLPSHAFEFSTITFWSELDCC